MVITTSNQKFEINEIGNWVYLLKDNKLLSGEIMEVKITQFYDKLGNMKMGIQYKIAGNWYFASEVFNGGGHANAAGGEYYGPLAEAVQLFLDNYAKYFKA